MGNKLLILCAFFVTLLFGDFKEIDNYINQIKQKRVGLSSIEIAKLKNPFITEKKIKKLIKKYKVVYKKRTRRLILQSIFDDKVKINYRWYKKGQRIGKYKIATIYPKEGYVILLSKNSMIKLFVHHKRYKKLIRWSIKK